ncbi:hypothetical protein GS429_10565 [Natronorubrum sp. JWXQ-INN-674]|uniref:DUF7344 domain-containing protein n=1 Tax=Natronorubrum halalkaliphilum TaxID=2691917 RepID=A0A6B0VLZ4_9EURY|nr:hypothetical protein [Natronorubrum halalkaliphilum]MXV62498.1 hypothetical protein [Natronorubrum halalkaliphilum]
MRETEGESAKITAEVTPSLDLIFDLLSNRRRRYTLYFLHDQPDGVATIDEVTEAVVALQSGDSDAGSEHAQTAMDPGPGPSAGPDSEIHANADCSSDLEQRRLRVRTELQHTHLPKLEDAGVLEHDQRSETVRYWTQPSLEEWLEHAQHKELS